MTPSRTTAYAMALFTCSFVVSTYSYLIMPAVCIQTQHIHLPVTPPTQCMVVPVSRDTPGTAPGDDPNTNPIDEVAFAPSNVRSTIVSRTAGDDPERQQGETGC